jgi:hypothetical protein
MVQVDLRARVMERAHFRCEYCLVPMAETIQNFEIDHIIALKHHGKTVLDNLALACFFCNNEKGPCIGGLDPKTRKIVRLFHPRTDRWTRHFSLRGAKIIGKTTMARATIVVLGLNFSPRVRMREYLIRLGVYPGQ